MRVGPYGTPDTYDTPEEKTQVALALLAYLAITPRPESDYEKNKLLQAQWFVREHLLPLHVAFALDRAKDEEERKSIVARALVMFLGHWQTRPLENFSFREIEY